MSSNVRKVDESLVEGLEHVMNEVRGAALPEPFANMGGNQGGNAGQHGEAAAMINLALHATTHIFEAAQELLEAWCNFLGFLLCKFKTVPGCSFWLFRFFLVCVWAV